MGENNHDHDEDVDITDNDGDDQEVDETEDDADTSQNNDAEDDVDDDGDEPDDDTSDDGGDDDSEGNSDTSSDTADDEDTKDDDDGSEPEIRKPKSDASNAEWAAWRKQEKDKAANKKSDKDNSDGDSDDDEDSDDLSPEDAAAIDKRIAKHIAPFQKQAAEQEVDTEIAKVLKDNPDFEPFVAKVKRFALHPSRQNVPVKSLFYEVAGDKLMQIGAQRAKAADNKANKTKTGGSNTNTQGQKGSKSYNDMSLDDFGKELDDIKTKPRQ